MALQYNNNVPYNAGIAQPLMPQQMYFNNVDNTRGQTQDQITNMIRLYGLTTCINDLEINVLNSITLKVNDLRLLYELLFNQNQQIDLNLYNMQYNNLISQRNILTVEIGNFVENYEILQNFVYDELSKWQREQTQAMGFSDIGLVGHLDEIQTWIERLIDLILIVRNAFRTLLTISQSFPNESDDNILQINLVKIIALHKKLFESTFIVEIQPGQIIKSKTKFSATIRWLIGKHANYMGNSDVLVECAILSDAQVQDYTRTQAFPQNRPAVIQNNFSKMKSETPTNKFIAEFKNMQINSIRRTDRRGSESVMDEKFALLFTTEIGLDDEIIRAWTFSVPVVVTVHANQGPHSIATILWDNSFAQVNRAPFRVPENVPWTAFADMLSSIMKKKTGRILNNEDINFLRRKIFGITGNIIDDDRHSLVSWERFCKDPLPNCSFSFWDWFYCAMKLLTEHFLQSWQAGHIIGFINKIDTATMLQGCQEGTFLLRFADSALGGISIAWLSSKGVKHVQPFSMTDLKSRKLADRLHDLKYLHYLYPNINKDDAFGSLYTPIDIAPRSTGYAPHNLQVVVSGSSEEDPMGSMADRIDDQYDDQNDDPIEMFLRSLI